MDADAAAADDAAAAADSDGVPDNENGGGVAVDVDCDVSCALKRCELACGEFECKLPLLLLLRYRVEPIVLLGPRVNAL